MQNKAMIFAHRGLLDDSFTENSMSAFRNCIEASVGIELDLRLTNDGVPVVFHDKTLKRMCRDSRKVSELTFEQLRNLRLDGTDEKIPSLEELLALVNGSVPLLIELKLPKRYVWHKRLERKVLPLIEQYKGEFMLQSFNKYSMKYMKRKLPTVKCGILSGDHYSLPSGFDFVNYRMSRLTPQKAAGLKERYPLVMGWIPAKMSRSEALEIASALSLDGAVI